MKKTLFVISHLESGSSFFVDHLNKNKFFMISNNSMYYDSFESLEKLVNKKHKMGDHPKSIYGDHLLYNFLFSCKRLYQISKFIYIISRPRRTLNLIIKNHLEYDQERAYNYYIFRIRRIYEMIKKTPDCVFLTYEDLQLGKYSFIIQEKFNFEIKSQSFEMNYENLFNEVLIEKAEKYYEKYFYKIKNIIGGIL